MPRPGISEQAEDSPGACERSANSLTFYRETKTETSKRSQMGPKRIGKIGPRGPKLGDRCSFIY
jgi:hypothetical protein